MSRPCTHERVTSLNNLAHPVPVEPLRKTVAASEKDIPQSNDGIADPLKQAVLHSLG